MNEAQTDEFELVDEGVFMDEVRKYMCLYDTKQKCYKNKKKHQEECMGIELNRSH